MTTVETLYTNNLKNLGCTAKEKTDSSSCLGITSEVVLRVVATSSQYIPLYQSMGAAGADLKAAILENIVIEPGRTALIPTGIFLEIPEGYEVQIRPRSGLAMKSQVTVLNAPGTIDSDYRGEVAVLLINHGIHAFTVTPCMRIAQMVMAPVIRATFQYADFLSETNRGSGGFGHTGH
jgi:dUTP pyrophosphatase